MKDIYLLKPANKTSSIVTSQSGCSDGFLLNTEEELKILKQKKHNFSLASAALKVKLGIDGRENVGRKTKYPRHILNNPDFKVLLGLKEEIFNLEKEIYYLNSKLKSEKLSEQISFERKYIDYVRKNYPEIHKEVVYFCKK